MCDDIKREAVDEAITRLGLIVPEAAGRMVSLLRDQIDIHPRQIATDYRKQGEQLSKEEKKALGVRSNAFLSRQAFEDLTQAGREEPLTAHETILLRATFTYNRYRTLQSFKSEEWKNIKGFEGVKYDVLNMNCSWCRENDGRLVQIEDARVFPAEECTCDTANYGFRAHVDFLAGWNDED
ncbi:UNVERIFIED_ORG: hypothetical protein GGI63_005239 [Rhizobium esperanzae]